jgi:CBS domain containing-hemolysin-like protein
VSWVEIVVSIVLIAASAFFVAIEFALVAARKYRLEEMADTSASARAALRSAKDISLLLAGSQLGITLCVLALGAITKPAVDYALEPVLLGWGIPAAAAGVASFVLSLVFVTFLHLVVGEMAPKSWAIAHPEQSATMLALPMRAFMFVTRPLLVALNGMANWCLHRVGVEPVDEMAAGRNPDDLRQLVDHSERAGALDSERRDQLVMALELDRAPISSLVHGDPAGVQCTDTVETIREVSRTSGHLRLVVFADGEVVGFVHVRDTLGRAEETTARDLLREVLSFDAETPVFAALGVMREKRGQLALVTSGGSLLGLVTMQDVVDRLLPA